MGHGPLAVESKTMNSDLQLRVAVVKKVLF